MFEVLKRNKRLWVVDVLTGEGVYTPPDFVRLQSRQPMIDLAAAMNVAGCRDIGAIIELETQARRCRKR